MYPKGSSLGCLKKFSLSSGILQIITAIFSGIGSLLLVGLAVIWSVYGTALLTGLMSLVSLESSSIDIFADMSMVTVILGVIAFVQILFFVLNIRRAHIHMRRNEMLKLYPSDSGLRVYRYNLVVTVFGFLWALIISGGLILGSLPTMNVIGIVTGIIPFVTMLLDLITWIYMTSKFDKLMEEITN